MDSNTVLPNLTFIYPDIASPTVRKVDSGAAPRERLAGCIQLRDKGWSVNISDSRWTGKLATVRRRLKRFLHLPSFAMIHDLRQTDLLVVKDDLSLSLLLVAKALGKKVIFLDAMFRLPTRWWRLMAVRLCARWCDRLVCFSTTQKQIWSRELGIAEEKIAAVPYGMDCDFYRVAQRPYSSRQRPYVVAVGRDPGRDFHTLAKAALDIDVKVKLVTLAYLVPDWVRGHSLVEVYEDLSYEELFALYAGAIAAVVPLKKGITYPSGIRAVMESMLLSVPTVASRTPVLEEYFDTPAEVALVAPEDPEALSAQLQTFRDDTIDRAAMTRAAKRRIQNNYSVNHYARELENVIKSVVNR